MMNADEPTAGWLQAEKDADLTLWLPGDVPMFFRRVPGKDWRGGNRFRIGARGQDPNEEPIHEVTLADPGFFYMATFPVTQLQYSAVTGARPSMYSGDYRPVEYVRWGDAIHWCELTMEERDRLSLKDRQGKSLEVGAIRLPLEHQWEIACRAGTDTAFFTGDGESALHEAACFNNDGTCSVGEKASNLWGLYDLHGNVWEWCNDLWDDDAYATRSEAPRLYISEPDSSAEIFAPRVLRGGSFCSKAADCRSATRGRYKSMLGNGSTGFRVCLFPGPADSQPER